MFSMYQVLPPGATPTMADQGDMPLEVWSWKRFWCCKVAGKGYHRVPGYSVQRLCGVKLGCKMLRSDMKYPHLHDSEESVLESIRWFWKDHMNKTGVWLVVWNMNFIFPYIGNSNPNWRSHIFQRGFVNHQPDVIHRESANWCGSPQSDDLFQNANTMVKVTWDRHWNRTDISIRISMILLFFGSNPWIVSLGLYPNHIFNNPT